MIKKYRISEQAISDLGKIWLYTLNKWSREQADRTHNLKWIRDVSNINLFIIYYHGKNNHYP